jgi:hypothetical protein
MKNIVCALVLCMSVALASAQEVYTSSGRPDHPGHVKKEKKTKGYDPSKLIIGGSLIAGFADGYADVGISPFVGYRITDRFSAGVGIGYEYIKQQQWLYNQTIGNYQNYPSQANIISPSLWARFFVYRNIFVVANFEYDLMNFNDYNYDVTGNGNIDQEKLNVGVPCLLLGAGIRQPLGGRLSAILEGMYDVLQQPYSPYLNEPDLRLSICVGL